MEVGLRRPARARLGLCLLLAIATLASADVGPLEGQSRLSQMRDPEDGAFDLSAWLATAGGFLPIARPVTEPAVGYGAALALAFVHRPPGWDIEEARERFENRERMDVPSASAAFGMYTASDSWAAGGGHLGIWGGGRWRYSGGLGLASLKLSIEGEVPGIGQALFDYRLDGWGLTQSLRYRLGSTDLMVGALYTFMRMEASFSADALPGLDPSPRESKLGSAGLTLVYDSRNNTFTPDRGLVVSAEGRRYDTWLGGDREYWSGSARLLAYLDPIRSVVLGLRTEVAGVGEGVPFWARPSVSLRGVASGRYAGDRAGTLEGEVRWDVSRRWSLVGFGGAGWKFSDTQADDDLRWVGGGGGGFRYLLARAFGLRGGLDFAYGEDGFAFYVTTGSAWPAF